MVMKKQSVANLVDIEIESDHPTDWTRNNRFNVAINNRKKQRRVAVLNNVSWLSVYLILLAIQKTKRHQRQRLLRKRTRLYR